MISFMLVTQPQVGAKNGTLVEVAGSDIVFSPDSLVERVDDELAGVPWQPFYL